MKKIYCLIFLILSIVCIIISIKLIIKNETVVYINSKNANILKNYMEEANIENTNSVIRIGLGNANKMGQLSIYYESGETYVTNISENYLFSNLSKYIRENGYNFDGISLFLAILSIIHFTIFIFLFIQIKRVI